ncbi:hypothetical protein [Nitrosomonas mobilis]|uniref:Uncharacterized protein n=1 Tax=Nitrosomonas mobilis TaxID=51642 RepID=A0A1G5SFV1_9PROT|nr:hypothetical protein [Nitrosomonas mobilis]SCZ86008.1 hypothetical protein NSMM_480010 [Nitrosomonas mobilis]
MEIDIRRAYDPVQSGSDDYRVLVDRPRLVMAILLPFLLASMFVRMTDGDLRI